MHKKLTLLIATGALGAAVAGCGTSKAPGVVLAPSGGATTESATSTSSTTTTSAATTTTASVPTPTSGPLSKEPTIAKPTGKAPTTLVKKDLVTGTGATAAAGDTVTVNYVGALYSNGKVFDSSWSRKQTFTTSLSTGSVIQGWVEGVPGMKVGGRRQLIIPASLAYKGRKYGEIPAHSTLIFDIDLLKVSR
jgi:peptidylprolyl isomerase